MEWFGLKKILPLQIDALLLYIEKWERSLYSLVSLLRTCKELARKANELLQTFYSVPYLGPREKLNEKMMELIFKNRYLLVGHASWFLVCCVHGCVDLIEENGEPVISCSTLKCPPACKRCYRPYDLLLLLHRRTRLPNPRIVPHLTVSLFQEEKIRFLLPWFVCEGRRSEKFNECLVKNRNYVIDIFYYLYSIPHSNEKEERQWNFLVKAIGRSFYLELTHNLGPIEASRRAIEEGNMSEVKKLENSTVIPDTIAEIIRLGKEGRETSLLIRTSDQAYLLTKESPTNAYMITSCVHYITTCAGLSFCFPTFVPLSLLHGMYRLPKGATNAYSSPYEKYKGVSPLAFFTVITYLFGICDEQILFSDEGFYPVTYRSLYEKDKIPITDIVYSLGGRKTKKFFHYRDISIDIFLSLRKFYGQARLFTDALRLPRIKIESRFMPRENDAKAVSAFTHMMDRSVSKGIGWWKYLGY